MTTNLHTAQATAIRAAYEAAEVLRAMFTGPLQHDTKKNPYDLVTEADRGAEEVIVRVLTAEFPDHHIVGEEGGGMGAPIEEAGYRWYVDPLDGTTNYTQRIPYFNTSLALTDRDLQPLVGVVYDPIADELFTAIRGQGATLNGQPIRVSGKDDLASSVVVTGFPVDKADQRLQANLQKWAQFTMTTRGTRRMGSAALEMAWVAAGRFDGFWEAGLSPWDCLGGILCVQEAGGRASDYDDQISEELYSGRAVVASNGRIHRQMLAVLNGK
jgi:myo-inositol-1(or 4)-monophosphatase